MQNENNKLDRQDLFYMKRVYELAQKAFDEDEVPIAAVLCVGDEVFEYYNKREATQLPQDHAEFRSIELACKKLETWRLPEATLYVSVEPCLMCTGLIYQSRIKRVVFSVPNPKGGALQFVHAHEKALGVNHSVEFESGIMHDETQELLKRFFKNKRKKL